MLTTDYVLQRLGRDLEISVLLENGPEFFFLLVGIEVKNALLCIISSSGALL
jgi:hypothetical protein